MTMINTLPQTRIQGFGAALRNLYAGLLEGFAMHNEYQRTVDTLQRLSDRELEDIGVVRADIPAVAARQTMDRYRVSMVD